MRKRAIIAIVVAGSVIAITAAVAVQNANSGIPHLEIRRQTIVGNELRLLVETSRSYYDSPMSHSSKTADVKGYLITVDLQSTKPPVERSYVYGPLWDVPNARSSISFDAGANFTREDRDAATATPYCIFDVDGTLLRILPDTTRKIMVRDALVVSPTGATWKRLGDWKHIDDDLGPMSEDRLETPSGKFKLIYKDGKATLYNAFTGEPKEDAWLTNSFALAHSNEDLENIRSYLTEDVNYLVVFPTPEWMRQKFEPGKPMLVKTFDLNGKTYNRGDVAILFKRANPTPTLAKREPPDANGFLFDNPKCIFSIDDQLFYFQSDEQTIRLYTPDKAHEFRYNAKSSDRRLPHCEGALHRPDQNEIVFFDTNEFNFGTKPNEAATYPNQTVSVVRWNYRENTIKRVDTRIWDLFNQSGGRLTTKAALPAK